MPQHTRRPSAKQRAQRRRRQEASPRRDNTVTQPDQTRPSPGAAVAVPAARSAAEQDRPQLPAAPRPATPRPASLAARGIRSPTLDLPLLTKELRQIGILAVAMFTVLIVLAIVLG